MTKEEIKESVSMRDILFRCGLPQPNRAGFICCPFHKGDREPSMKIYEKAVIDGWLYDVKYADKTKTEIYLHLEEVRKIDS